MPYSQRLGMGIQFTVFYCIFTVISLTTLFTLYEPYNQAHVLDYVKIMCKFSSQAYTNGTTHLSKANGSLTNGHVKHANGHANGKANGVANGYTNGHANGHANGSIYFRGASAKEANGHIPQAGGASAKESNGHIPQAEGTSFSVRARRLVCMSVDTSLE